MRQLKINKQITQRTEESVSRYFQDIAKYPMVTPDEEVELAMRIRKGNDYALEKLVVANLRFVISVAKQFQNQGLSLQDLINEGNYGLVKAAKKFDEKRGFKFISYAVWWIRQSIIQAISDQNRIVRLPLNRLSSINKITRAITCLEQKLEREPSDTEIADYLHISKDEVKLANRIKNRQVSFDKPLSREDNNEYSLYDVMQTENMPSPDNDLMKDSVAKDIKRALNKLTEREAEILSMSFGLCGTPTHSLRNIASKHEMSTERVRQIRNTGLLKLRHLLKENYAF